jgi:hypothetical protein
MNPKDIKELTPEHEAAKQVFMETYIFPEYKPSMQAKYLRELIWDKAVEADNIEFVPAGERKAYFKYRRLAY